jgi:hypothetical protein
LTGSYGNISIMTPSDNTRTVWLVEWAPVRAGRQRKRKKPLCRVYESEQWAKRRVETLAKQARSEVKVLRLKAEPEDVSDIFFAEGRYDIEAVEARRKKAQGGPVRGYLLDNDFELLEWLESGKGRDTALSMADRIVNYIRRRSTEQPTA